MWKIVKAWTLFWWQGWWAGPPARMWAPTTCTCVTTDSMEAAVERACRRILSAHAARLAETRDTTPVLIRFVDQNETAIQGERLIPTWHRSPTLEFEGQQYRAARFDEKALAWIYRRA